MKRKPQKKCPQMNEKKPGKPESNKYKINKNTLTPSLTYRMSYVLGGLYLQESLIVADEYIKNKNWEKTKSTILTENRLQTNMKRSSQRMYREIALRLKTLSETQLNLLLSGTAEEKRQLLWLACCKSYRLIFEVATELLDEKLSSGEKHLSIPDYEAFYTKKALKSEKLQILTDTTRRKIKNVTLKIMREADIITKDNEILPQLLSKKIQRVISEENPQLMEVYP